jgi:hypothetical protein
MEALLPRRAARLVTLTLCRDSAIRGREYIPQDELMNVKAMTVVALVGVQMFFFGAPCLAHAQENKTQYLGWRRSMNTLWITTQRLH